AGDEAGRTLTGLRCGSGHHLPPRKGANHQSDVRHGDQARKGAEAAARVARLRADRSRSDVGMKAPVVSPWIDVKGAMAYLGLESESAVYRLVREHRLPHGRVGRAYRFDTRALDRWIESAGLEFATKTLRLAR